MRKIQKSGCAYAAFLRTNRLTKEAYPFAKWKSEQVLPYNHKVVKIEITDRIENVYDLTVDDHHNFAVSAGVFVHNCHSGDLDKSMIGPPPSYWTRFKKLSMFWKRPPLEKPKHFPMPAAVLNEVRRFKMKGASCRAMAGGLLDVGFSSACRSNQTASDTVMEGKPCGAFTYFFVKRLRAERNVPLSQIVKDVNADLSANGYSQQAQAEGARVNGLFLK
jgi:hypothetical protein